MADCKNRKVKVVDICQPQRVSASVYLKENPWALALLDDGLIAATTGEKVIYLLQVAETVTVKSRLETGLMYNGVADHSNNELIVSCWKLNNNGVGRVDLITRSGCVVRTITDSKSVISMNIPSFLCVVDNHVLVSDCVSNAVYKVNISNGKLVDTQILPNMLYPCNVTADSSGNWRYASFFGDCVLMCTPSGQWRTILEASQHSDKGYDNPLAVCVLNSGRLVVSWRTQWDSRVIAYDL